MSLLDGVIKRQEEAALFNLEDALDEGNYKRADTIYTGIRGFFSHRKEFCKKAREIIERYPLKNWAFEG